MGDAITVEGILKNYKGTIEFDKGCVLVGYGEIVSQEAIVDAAYALESGAAMTAPTALVGEVVSIRLRVERRVPEHHRDHRLRRSGPNSPFSAIVCSGEGAKELEVGDEIAVYGTIKNYKGTVEFDKGCVTGSRGLRGERPSGR